MIWSKYDLDESCCAVRRQGVCRASQSSLLNCARDAVVADVRSIGDADRTINQLGNQSVQNISANDNQSIDSITGENSLRFNQ